MSQPIKTNYDPQQVWNFVNVLGVKQPNKVSVNGVQTTFSYDSKYQVIF